MDIDDGSLSGICVVFQQSLQAVDGTGSVEAFMAENADKSILMRSM